MIKTIHKWFWIWDFDKEERWLNEMAAKGLALHSVGFCRYAFEETAPGAYKVCIEFTKQSMPEKEKYIRFLEETGVEHIGRVARWDYFRRKGAEEFTLFSDRSSKIDYLTRVIRYLTLFCGINLYYFIYMMWLYAEHRNGIGFISVLNLAVALLCFFGILRLLRKRKRLRDEGNVFE